MIHAAQVSSEGIRCDNQKMIEKISAAQLRLFLETNKIFCISQNSFREKKGTISAISKLMEQL